LRLVAFGREHFPTLAAWFGSERELVQWGGTLVHYPLDDRQMDAMLRLGETDPPERLCWMAVEDTDLVGHAQLAYDWRNGNARIGRVAIAPRHRGRGLAKPLLRLIIARAFADPAIERLELYAIAYNRHAIRIYETLGFVHEGEARAAIRIGGERFGNLTMSMLRSEFRQPAAERQERPGD
jgi:RimJ/RimL family protein N-acetyltransferase